MYINFDYSHNFVFEILFIPVSFEFIFSICFRINITYHTIQYYNIHNVSFTFIITAYDHKVLFCIILKYLHFFRVYILS